MPSLADVYQKFGEVSEAAQLLETELGTLLLCTQGSEHDLWTGDKGELATDICNKINESTIGQVLRRLGNAIKFPGQLDQLLSVALADRNRLCHSFYRKHNFRQNCEEGRTKMIEDLNRMHHRILEAYEAVLALSGIHLDGLMAVPLPIEHAKI